MDGLTTLEQIIEHYGTLLGIADSKDEKTGTWMLDVILTAQFVPPDRAHIRFRATGEDHVVLLADLDAFLRERLMVA